jgi:hypothetical protein
MLEEVTVLASPTEDPLAAVKLPPAELDITTVLDTSVDVPRALAANVRLPPAACTAKFSGRLRMGSVREVAELLSAVTVIEPVAAPVTATVPLPPTLSFPAER